MTDQVALSRSFDFYTFLRQQNRNHTEERQRLQTRTNGAVSEKWR